MDATIIEAPSSTKNARRERDPEMHQAKKGNQWHFGMKAHIGVDAESGLAHSLETTAANVSDVATAHAVLHGDEEEAWGDAGYQGVAKRPENAGSDVDWRTAMRPGKRRVLDKSGPEEAAEKRKASMRAKVEHPFLYVKRHFGYAKVRYRGLAKNTQPDRAAAGFLESAHRWPLRDGLNAGPLRPFPAETAGKRGGRRRIRGFRGHFRNNRKHFSPWNGFPITKRVPDALRRSETGLDQTFPRSTRAPKSGISEPPSRSTCSVVMASAPTSSPASESTAP